MRPFAALLFADRASVAIERDDWAAAGTFAEQALTICAVASSTATGRAPSHMDWLLGSLRHGVIRSRDDNSSTGRSTPAAAHLPAPRGLRPGVGGDGARLRRAGRSGGARAVLRQATTSSSSAPPSGTCPSRPTSFAPGSRPSEPKDVGASSLTSAELRLVPLLQTHLSFREIGERLYISRHTVKTQALSIYRRLGVSSRSAAIDRLHELGLFEHA